jgi:catechol 2,3-dioxygenase-like lactoylglutathione lyase family enzyme
MIRIDALDHIVLCVRDVPTTIAFYERVLGMEARQERPGKWSLHFGANKISLQDAAASPSIARDTVPGSGNFCLLTEVPMADVVARN